MISILINALVVDKIFLMKVHLIIMKIEELIKNRQLEEVVWWETDRMVARDRKDPQLTMKGKSAFQMAEFLKITNHIVNKIMKNNKDIIKQSLLKMTEDGGDIVDVAKVKYQDNIIIKVDIISLNKDENSTRLNIMNNQLTTEIKIKRKETTTKMFILMSHQEEEDLEALKINNIIKTLILTNDLIKKDVNSIRQNVRSSTIMMKGSHLEQEKVTWELEQVAGKLEWEESEVEFLIVEAHQWIPNILKKLDTNLKGTIKNNLRSLNNLNKKKIQSNEMHIIMVVILINHSKAIEAAEVRTEVNEEEMRLDMMTLSNSTTKRQINVAITKTGRKSMSERMTVCIQV